MPSETEVVEPPLRHVETDVLIPKMMRAKAKERCHQEVKEFTDCCKDSGLGMVLKCRTQNSQLRACLTKYYKDPEFYDMCKQEYLQQKREFQETGIRKSSKTSSKLPTTM
ncbi:COX assembly mitochondrial protein homolog [Branchiostoma floridae]|uniref:COX assembly mitochondrial protein n=1 Tax=Branchiostoma floridae TaxID=7739 RepID=A0A9J7NCQ4_BRAFL|nr:COX assembly mitochondrial protein homolog [Branchiostoma floridae]